MFAFSKSPETPAGVIGVIGILYTAIRLSASPYTSAVLASTLEESIATVMRSLVD